MGESMRKMRAMVAIFDIGELGLWHLRFGVRETLTLDLLCDDIELSKADFRGALGYAGCFIRE